MFRWLGALVAAASMTWFAVLLVTGDYYNEGPVLFTVSAFHGIHRGDVGVASFWAAGMIGLLAAASSGHGTVRQQARAGSAPVGSAGRRAAAGTIGVRPPEGGRVRD